MNHTKIALIFLGLSGVTYSMKPVRNNQPDAEESMPPTIVRKRSGGITLTEDQCAAMRAMINLAEKNHKLEFSSSSSASSVTAAPQVSIKNRLSPLSEEDKNDMQEGLDGDALNSPLQSPASQLRKMSIEYNAKKIEIIVQKLGMQR